MAEIQIRGLDKIERTLGKVADAATVRAGLKSAGLVVIGNAREYPPVSRRPQPFRSDRQRRGFFARLRSGEIEVPYRRGISPGSETMGRKWNLQVTGNVAVVGNTARYSPLVIGAGTQTAYHRGTGWRTVDTIAQETADDAERAFARVVAMSLLK